MLICNNGPQVTPGIFSATVSWFGGGADYPAGSYFAGYTPGNNAGTQASLQTTVTLGSTINARYLRYSGKDTGAGAQVLLTDFSVS